MQIRNLLHRGFASALKSDRQRVHGGWFESLESRRLLSTAALATYAEGALDQQPRYFVEMPANWHRARAHFSPAAPKQSTDASNGRFTTQAVQANDTVVFGDAASETNHAFTQTNSQVIAGALGQSARQLLPKSTPEVNGGEMTFTMTVDPVERNYFTVKLWGSDDVGEDMGRLYLYVPIGGVNYQVGYRHEGDYMPLSVTAEKPPLPGRFYYSTTMLPLTMTQGKTSLTLKVISTGRIYGLGSGAESSGGNYQFNMDIPSRGIYRAYTHTQPLLDVTGETQGSAPTTTIRNTHTESGVLGPSGTYTTSLNNWVSGRLAAADNQFLATQVELLARSYTVSQLPNGYQNQAVVAKVIAVLDGFAANYYTSPYVSPTNTGSAVDGSNLYGGSGDNVWGGRYGALGWAIHLLSTQLQSSLDTVVDYGGGGGLKTRRQAWGDMLLGSRDYGRFTRDDRYITNQTLIADSNIYKANKGLLALGNASAFSETTAQRYLKEAIGLAPWLGSDLTSGGGSSLKYGSNYYQVTGDGLTRKWGYAGGYSEMSAYAAHFYKWTGNAEFKDQAIKMIKAMSYFRRPAVDISGANNYRSMERIGLLAWRGVRESDGDFANEIAYGNQGPWSEGMRVAGVTLDPSAVGYAKQMLADGQYFSQLMADSRYRSGSFDARFMMEVWDDYDAVKNAADSGIRLPMSDGQPDFAWADEQSGIAAIKQGTTRLWIEPYWQAKTGTGVNGVGRFHYSTASYDQYGALETNAQLTSTSGAYFVRTNNIDKPETNHYVPPDNPSNAYAGERLPVGDAPADAKDGTPFRGKVSYYAFRYGKYLIGMNTTSDRSYELKLPTGVTSAIDLVSGTIKNGPVMVGPNSTVVLDVNDTHDAAPLPTAPLLVIATGSATQVSLEWTAASGAASYNVKRAASPGGPYTTVAAGLTGTTYTDTTVAQGQQYYYAVSATNSNGESYNSMETLVSAGLPSPWTSQDVGTVTTPGSANYSVGTFTINGSGGDIGGSSDSLHFGYRTMTGDDTLIARLASEVIGGSANDKVGLMMRETLAGNSRSVTVLLDSSTSTARLATRSSAGGGTSYINGPTGITVPQWFKLQRVGNTFTGFVSSDGTTWTQVASSTATMGSTIYVGLAVCSRDQTALNTSRFDNVSLASANANAAPTIATPASATPNPVTGTTTNLSVLGADDAGEANLIYIWSATGPAAVAYSANGINAAKNAVATFSRAGSYTITATIRDSGGLTTTSSMNVTVNQTLTSVDVTPATASVAPNATQQFTATGFDQFGVAMSTQPGYTWSVTSGGGTVDSSGLYTAPGTTGSATVQAVSGSLSDSAAVTISAANQAPTVATPASASPSPVTGSTTGLSVVGADDAGEANLTYTWAVTAKPSGAADPTYSVNGTNAAKNATATFFEAGGYAFQVTITDAGGLSTTSSVSVTVNQTLSSVDVTPAAATVNVNATQQFTATGFDQFGQAMSTQPSFAWSVVNGGGTISTGGLYTAPATAGSATVQATAGSISDTAAVTISATAQILQQSTGTGDKQEVKNGQKGAQSFRHGSAAATYQVTKVVLQVSRESQAPNANLVVSIGTGINSGTVSGASVSIPMSAITNTSSGSSFQTLEVVFASPITLNGNQLYYLNFECQASNGKAVYLRSSASNTYANGTYYKAGSDQGKDLWFQLYGY